MKITYMLFQNEIEKAIIDYLKNHKSIDAKTVKFSIDDDYDNLDRPTGHKIIIAIAE